MLKALRIIGAVLTVIGLAGIAATHFATSAMMVAIGVRALSMLSVLSYVVAGVGAATFLGGTIPAVADRIRQQNDQRLLESDREKDRKNFTDYAHDSLNPEKTRVRLEQLRRNNPNLSQLVDRCIDQLDRMDTYQARHKALLQANEAIYLEDTIEIINQSERRMCRNIRNIINCCILIEDTDKDINELDQGIITGSLADNEEELGEVATLLRYSVAYINNYNRNGVSDRRELDAWLKIMKASTGGSDEKI